ncbi:MAG: hypothetical protein HY316_00175, partial [Acidobacteria bacterium]|nr:hypothetical protein [Acidobacteriota bacterium]
MAKHLSQFFHGGPMDGKPHIDDVGPRAAIAGGELQIRGQGFCPNGHSRPRVKFGGLEGSLLVCSDQFLVARVPEGAVSSELTVDNHQQSSNPIPVEVGVAIAENMHPV